MTRRVPKAPLARVQAARSRIALPERSSGSLGSETPFAVTGAQSIPNYPAALDATPVLIDSQSPMVALWINLLQQMIEAVQAEVGPIPQGMRRGSMPGRTVDTLQKLLGQQTDASAVPYTESYAALCSATTGNGKPAGTLYGVQKVRVTRSSWTDYTDYTTTITNPFGVHPTFKRPIAWGVPIVTSANSMNWQMEHGPAKIVAEVDSISVSGTTETFTVKYAGITSHPTTLTPTGTWTFDICILYMPTEDDA